MAEESLPQEKLLLTDRDGYQLDGGSHYLHPENLLLTITGNRGVASLSVSLTFTQTLRLVGYCTDWLSAQAAKEEATCTPVQEVDRG